MRSVFDHLSHIAEKTSEQVAKDMTDSLRVLLKNNDVPVRDYRAVRVGTDMNVHYSQSRAESIERREYGLGTNIDPQPHLRRFATRLPQMVQHYLDTGGSR